MNKCLRKLLDWAHNQLHCTGVVSSCQYLIPPPALLCVPLNLCCFKQYFKQNAWRKKRSLFMFIIIFFPQTVQHLAWHRKSWVHRMSPRHLQYVAYHTFHIDCSTLWVISTSFIKTALTVTISVISREYMHKCRHANPPESMTSAVTLRWEFRWERLDTALPEVEEEMGKDANGASSLFFPFFFLLFFFSLFIYMRFNFPFHFYSASISVDQKSTTSKSWFWLLFYLFLSYKLSFYL